MCEEIDDSERQFTEQDLNDAFKAGMRWLKFNYTENWDGGYVDDWRDFIGKKRKAAEANGTKEETGRAASDVNALVSDNERWIPTKHAMPKAEGTYDVIVTTTGMDGSKKHQTTAEFKWIELGDGSYTPSWSKGFDWSRVTHFKP